MTDEQREELILEAKQFYFAAPLLKPLLEKRWSIAYSRLLAKFREGSINDSLVAELAVLSDLKAEILRKENEFKSLEEQHADRK